ncbi:MAG: tRNA preQ1(34) S-adenosylmethionine ribosyltransferase-isomerase QueA [Deltaproteobacteria bacterium]|nr:tRNA preQ1(34) S-adenosylmethionine ribosyltransferase-isomerase QueA [Deltaproteobacteria bacterium]
MASPSNPRSDGEAGPLDYLLPPELIAQQPAARRDESRLMIVDRSSGRLNHVRFGDLADWLPPRALLVANDSKVIPARLHGRKVGSDGAVEVLLLGADAAHDTRARALTRSSKGMRPGQSVMFAEGVTALVEGPVDQGRCVLEFAPRTVTEVLASIGELPLPPYIDRPQGPSATDAERYQTVYARSPGSVAAPTAGLHFTAGLLERLQSRGFEFTKLTLHVGPGTFIPVRGSLDDHQMEEEQFEIGEEAAAKIVRARRDGRAVVAVGTTTVRALEGAHAALRSSPTLAAARDGGLLAAGRGRTALFIRPGHRFAVVDALVTNFHLPGSTLLALVMAVADPQLVRDAYAVAVAERYRFYSFGDAMLIL